MHEGFSLWSIITPALIASVISLYLGQRSEKRRAERDFITKLYDSARDDVRKAVEAGVDYFPRPLAERTLTLEAKVWMSERDVRHSVSSLLTLSEQAGEVEISAVEDALADLIDALTGGSFQSATAAEDIKQARKVATSGARLRVALSTLRQNELRAAIDADVVSRHLAPVRDYLMVNTGVDRERSQARRDFTEDSE